MVTSLEKTIARCSKERKVTNENKVDNRRFKFTASKSQYEKFCSSKQTAESK